MREARARLKEKEKKKTKWDEVKFGWYGKKASMVVNPRLKF